MKTTTNYGLKKPDGTDLVNIEDLNGNMDTVDAQLKTATNHAADTVKHITSTERNNWNAKASTAVATTSANGLMAAADKTKLDGVAAGANNYVHPAYTTRSSALYRFAVDATGHVTWVSTATKADITALGIPADGTGKSLAGQSVKPTSTTTVTAGTGAEIFNDYAERTFSGTTILTGNVASGEYSHAEGCKTTAFGKYAHAEGCTTKADGVYSHAEGFETTARGPYSHAEGNVTSAYGGQAHAEGYGTSAAGNMSHAEGQVTKATGACSHTEGVATEATGACSHAEGHETIASGEYSHSEGKKTIANNYASHASGRHNKAMTSGGTGDNVIGDAFVIGNGTSNTPLSNAFRITFAGTVYGKGSFNTSGADYAEFFEWADGNPGTEDRVGYFVTLDGDKIKIAKPGDYILGIISGSPCIIGNGDEDWLGRWERDEFGRSIKEDVNSPVTRHEMVDVPVLDADGNPTGETKPELQEVETGEVIRGWRFKANPDYDPRQTYVERKDRKEWDCVGMLGVLAVRDDGTCQVNGYCKPSDGGVATAAERYIPDQTYRVIKRVTDNVVQIVFR